MQYYNVHSHIFTMTNAPKRFLNLYMWDVAAYLVDKITNTKAGTSAIIEILNHAPGMAAKRYASFLKIGKSADQGKVFETLRQQYDDPNTKFVALTMYMEQCGAGESLSNFEGQIEEILNVKRQYPDQLLIFLGLDPRWDTKGVNLKQIVQQYFETKLKINETRSVYPFVGLKLYPSTGFYAFDERLQETFQWAAENDIPVLSHCNYLGGIYNNDTNYLKQALNPQDPYTGQKYKADYISEPSFWKKIFGRNNAHNNLITCSYFLEPYSFRSMLAHFKATTKNGLKLCLAHYGGDDHILAANNIEPVNTSKLYGVNKIDWCTQIRQLMGEYPNLYTDISYAIHNPKIHKPILQEMVTAPYADRLMFGTDFFLTEREMPEKNDYKAFREKAMQTQIGAATAWDKMAGINIENFLYSKYYPGKVI